MQKLFDNLVTHVITERQAETRFLARQKRAGPARGRKLLEDIRRRIASRATATAGKLLARRRERVKRRHGIKGSRTMSVPWQHG